MNRAVVGLIFALCSTAQTQTLPLIDEVDWPRFRIELRGLTDGLKKLETPLPTTLDKSLAELIRQEKPNNPRIAARSVQKILDPLCLIGITINPESRVKATRGDRDAILVLDQPAYFLVRVQNEGGVTHPLMVHSEQAIQKGAKHPDRWLEVNVVNDKPFAKQLSGQLIEYRVLRLVARQSGKREATLSFDVGQGTQDLGFRSEVPILFTIKKR